MTTRVGTLHLLLPQVREGGFSTTLFERYQRTEQALLLTLMDMVVNGVSTRKVSRITEDLCGKEFSKSLVSELCQQLDPVVHTWNERRLEAQAFPFVIRGRDRAPWARRRASTEYERPNRHRDQC